MFSILQVADNTIYEPNTAQNESTDSLPEMSPILPPGNEGSNAISQVCFFYCPVDQYVYQLICLCVVDKKGIVLFCIIIFITYIFFIHFQTIADTTSYFQFPEVPEIDVNNFILDLPPPPTQTGVCAPPINTESLQLPPPP